MYPGNYGLNCKSGSPNRDFENVGDGGGVNTFHREFVRLLQLSTVIKQGLFTRGGTKISEPSYKHASLIRLFSHCSPVKIKRDRLTRIRDCWWTDLNRNLLRSHKVAAHGSRDMNSLHFIIG